RSAESTNGMMSRVLDELRQMRELLAQNKQQNERFEGVDDEEYDAVVDYCVWLAGCTPCECANAYVKNLLRDNISEYVTWHGSHGTLALKGTRLVEAFEEAMNNNKKFGKVNRADSVTSMKRALHSAKERLRKSRISATSRSRIPRMEMEDEDE
ncbi:hypothetical protein PV325_011105, partial [Microctonus aethiopoides]